jgi:hypothetical protein
MGMHFTYLECVIVGRRNGDRDETLSNRFQHLADSITSSRAFELLSQLSGYMDRCAEFDHSP